MTDELDLNDTPETAPNIAPSHRTTDAKKARELRDSPQFKALRKKFRDDSSRHRNHDGSIGAPCHLCFSPDTLVRTYNGYTAIKDVAVGDRVLTSDGTWQNVHKVLKRTFTGEVVLIRTSSMTRPVLVTAEHPILGLYADHHHRSKLFINEDGPFCSPGLCQPATWRIGPHGNQRPVPNIEKKTRGKLHKVQWIPAGQLQKQSWVATAAPSYEEDLYDITLPHGPHRKGPATFELTDEFLWMLGLYIAEGSTESRPRHPHRSLAFSLHRDEIDYQQRLLDLFSSLGYNPTVGPNGAPGTKGIQVHVHSTTLGEWAAKTIGTGSHRKRIPEKLMRLPWKRAQHIVRGIYDGDGCGQFLGQTSEVLALQVMELAARSGTMATCSTEHTPAATPSGNTRKPVFKVSWPSNLKTAQSGRWQFGHQFLTQVRQHKLIPYSGDVYNLEVDGDHTYTVQNIAVHNCGQDIDYRLQYGHPQAFELDHVIPVKERPDLLMDRENFAPSHHDCNQIRGTDAPPLQLGEPSEEW